MFDSFNLVHLHHIETPFTMAAAAVPRALFSTLYDGSGSYWELPTPDYVPLSAHFGTGMVADAAAMPVRAMIKHFRHEFEYHVEHKTCMVPAYI